MSLVCSPLKMKDIRRLYVNTSEGDKLGYIDLATMEVVTESEASDAELRSALSVLGSPSDVVRTARSFVKRHRRRL